MVSLLFCYRTLGALLLNFSRRRRRCFHCCRKLNYYFYVARSNYGKLWLEGAKALHYYITSQLNRNEKNYALLGKNVLLLVVY